MGVQGLGHYSEVLQQLRHRFLEGELIVPVTIDANALNNVAVGDLLTYQAADSKYNKLQAITNIAAEILAAAGGVLFQFAGILVNKCVVPGTVEVTYTSAGAPHVITGDNGSGVFGNAEGVVLVDYVTGAIFVHCLLVPTVATDVTIHYHHYTITGAWNGRPVAIALEAADATGADKNIMALLGNGDLRESQLGFTFTDAERNSLKINSNIIVR